MFNTSTLISLGLTALLCGIIMFYCKRKFAEYEQKLDVMSDLISNIITQLNQIPSSVYDNSGFMPQCYHNEEVPANIDMSVMPEEDSDDDDDNHGDNHEIVENSAEDKRIIVNLGSNFESEQKTISLSEEPLDEDSWDSEESDDEDGDNKISIQEHDLNVVVESENLHINNTEATQAKIAQEVAEEMVSKIVEDSSSSQFEDGVKVIDTSAPVEVDYNKMQVGILKKMVSERKLAQGVSKMKKQELIDVLMSKSQ